MRTLALFLGAAATAGLLCLSMVSPSFAFLAWLALIPLYFTIRFSNGRESFFYAWISGSIFFLLLLYWLSIPVWEHGGVYRYPGLVGLILLFVLLGLFWAVWGYLTHRVLFAWRVSPLLVLPVLWTALELLRRLIISPLPLGFVGYSQTPYPFLLQLADVFGVHSITLLVVLVNTALFLVLVERLSLFRFLMTVLMAAVLVGSYGYLRLNAPQEELLKVGIVQGNIAQEDKWDLRLKERNLDVHLLLSRELPDVELLVWPESAVPVAPEQNDRYWYQIEDLVRQKDTPLLIGLLNMRAGKVYNSAFLIVEGRVVDKYDKKWLAPFGEYIPLSSIFGWVETGFFPTTPGTELSFFNHHGLTWATPICYEIYNTGLVRRMSRESDFLIHLSNEAWFKDSHALDLLWAVGVIRAVETRRPIVKVANTGISGFVDDQGLERVVLASLQPDTKVVSVTSAGLDSLYVRFGDWPLLVLMSLLLIIAEIMGPGGRRWGEQAIR